MLNYFVVGKLPLRSFLAYSSSFVFYLAVVWTTYHAQTLNSFSTDPCTIFFEVNHPTCVEANSKATISVTLYDELITSPDEERRLIIEKEDGTIVDDVRVDFNSSGIYIGFFTVHQTGDQKYNVYYKDQIIGCQSIKEITIKGRPYYQVITQDLSCAGSNDGNIEIQSGDPNLSITWYSGGTSPKITNLSSGIYKVTISKTNGCAIEDRISINQPKPIEIVFNPLSVDCGDTTENILSAIVTGGTKPYNYDWDYDGIGDYDDSKALHNMNPKVYTLSVKDNNACITKRTQLVNFQNPHQIIANDAIVTSSNLMNDTMAVFDLMQAANMGAGDVDNDGDDGSVMELSFHKDSMDAINNVFPLNTSYQAKDGTIIFARVASSEGCFDIAEVQLEFATKAFDFILELGVVCQHEDPILLEPRRKDSLTVPKGGVFTCISGCENLNSNPIFIDSQGNYYWNPAYSGEGDFEIMYCVGQNCGTDFLDVEAQNFNITADNSDVCGNGDPVRIITSDGILVSGPGIKLNNNKGYFEFHPTEVDTGMHIISGSKFAVFTNILGDTIHTCTRTLYDTLNVLLFPSIVITANANPVCDGDTLKISIDSDPICTDCTYEWYLNDTLFSTEREVLIDSVSKKYEGKYVAIATNLAGCFDTDTVDLKLYDLPDISCDIKTQVSCFGASDGIVKVNVTGSGTFSYLWSNGDTTDTADSLSVGIYSVEVTDSNGCSAFCTVEVSQPDSIQLSVMLVDSITCHGSMDGKAEANPSGGNGPPYFYLWSNGDTAKLADSLGTGWYRVVVMDSLGCSVEDSIFMTEPLPLSCNAIQTQKVICKGESNGIATVTGSGGNGGPYSYLWDNGDTTAIADSLEAGEHTVTVTDRKGCTSECSVIIVEPDSVRLTLMLVDSVRCKGESNGKAALMASGGNSQSFTILWSNGDTSLMADSLASMWYSVIVTDSLGCAAIDSIFIPEPDSLLITASVINHVDCAGDSTGEARVIAKGGNAGSYQYLWSNGDQSQMADSLSAGKHFVTVTDTKDCQAVDSVLIIEPDSIKLLLSIIDTVSCHGENDGKADVSISGGTAKYSILWSNGDSTVLVDSLASMWYSVTVTDSLGCSAIDSIFIPEPDSLIITASVINHVDCAGDSTGKATVIAKGGNAGSYQYLWSNGDQAQMADSLSAGKHFVTVTDTKDCQAVDSVLIQEPDSIKLLLSILDTVSCHGENDGKADVSISGGTAKYSILWSNGDSTVLADSLASMWYSVTVTDSLGCSAIDSIFIPEPDSLLITASVINHVNCAGDSTGEARVIAKGGNAGSYQYLWSNGDQSQMADSLSAGKHFVTVTDTKDCQAVDSVLIQEPDSIKLLLSILDTVSCHGENDGKAQLSISGGTANYSISWSNGDTTVFADSLASMWYSVIVTDHLGCEAVDSIFIPEPELFTISPLVVQNQSCYGDSTGKAEVKMNGGNGGPYKIKWANGDSTQSIEFLKAGTHWVTVSDSRGCEAISSVTITEPEQLSVQLAGPDSLCYPPGLGSIKISVNGGTLPYSYDWDNDGTGDFDDSMNLDSLAGGMYKVVVRDSSGCLDSLKVAIFEGPYAGMDGRDTICNSDPPAVMALFPSIEGSPDSNGIWMQTSGEALEFINQDTVNFMCAPAGDYEFLYIVPENGTCPPDTAIVTIHVVSCFDLALLKIPTEIKEYEYGDDVSYTIEVHNQGEVEADSVIIYDYIQEGFDFFAGKNTAALTGNDSNWNLVANDTAGLYIGTLQPLSSKTVVIILTIQDDFPGFILNNYSEIVYYTNGVKAFPPDEDDKDEDFTYIEKDDDIDDDFNGKKDNPLDDDQFDGATISLCGVDVLACNSLVRLSLNENCEVEVFADNILEGEYACISQYNILIDSIDTNIINCPGNYTVNVITNSDPPNSCWGTLIVEDKYSQELICQDHQVACFNDITPGSTILVSAIDSGYAGLNKIANSTSEDEILSGNTDDTAFWSFDINAPLTAKTEEIKLTVDISHEDISELTAFLVSPQNDSLTLFSEIQKSNNNFTCLKEDLIISLDDLASFTYDELRDSTYSCRPLDKPSIWGSFKASDHFSSFKDSLISGVWKFILLDSNPTESSGQINSIVMEYVYGDGRVSFPVPDSSSVVITQTGEREYSVEGLGKCDIIRLSYFDSLEQVCSEDTSYRIIRSWTGYDLSGNLSQCQQIISFRNPHFSDFIWPLDYDGMNNPAFRCYEFKEDQILSNGAPSPEVTGYPYIYHNDKINLCNNLEFSYGDIVLYGCGSSKEYLRTWTILDWCLPAGNIMTHRQIIKIKDDIIPICDPAKADTLEVFIEDQDHCDKSVLIPPPGVLLECSSYHWTVEYNYIGSEYQVNDEDHAFNRENVYYSNESNIAKSDNARDSIFITNLPIGYTWVRYIITDECGNINEGACKILIKVSDVFRPTAVCDLHTVVALGPDGNAKMKAESINDLSWDNCEIDSFAIRKVMKYDFCNAKNLLYGSELDFCCEELGDSIPVEMLVVDINGNTNTCMSNVVIQDKVPPYFRDCPKDITLSCEDDYKDTSLTGFPIVEDNCGIEQLIFNDQTTLDDCGLGTVTRIWEVEDLAGKRNICIQDIVIEDANPFEMKPGNWPKDITINVCNSELEPADTGEPDLTNNGCNLLTSTYEDLHFYNVDEYCQKTVRTWFVIDWCQFGNDSSSSKGYWRKSQQIIIDDNEAPNFNDYCNDFSFCSYGPDCDGFIDLIFSATDNCSDENDLKWDYQIDLFKDGLIEEYLTGNSNDASGTYPIGVHAIYWEVTDRCGNIAQCKQEFEIQDCKNPTPVCLESLVSVIMPVSGTLPISADGFNVAANDNCDGPVRFSFSTDIADSIKVFSCNDFNESQKEAELEIWLTDEAGNQDFCQITLEIQAGTQDVCNLDPPQSASIVGKIRTMDNQAVFGTSITLNANVPEFPRITNSDITGTYTFLNVPRHKDYQITASKNDHLLNGISTLDMVLIQQHILGLKEFNSAFKIIASDIDNNQVVSVLDLLHLRKLILGNSQKFPNGQNSWRFIDNSAFNQNSYYPFPYDEKIELNQLDQNLTNQNLTAVKIGDVNLSSSLNEVTEIRNVESFEFFAIEQEFKAGQKVEVELFSEHFDSVLGFQFTLKTDPRKLKFSAIRAGQLPLSFENLGIQKLDDGLLKFSWSQARTFPTSDKKSLFIVIFNALSDAALSESLSFSSELLTAELYDESYTTYVPYLKLRHNDLNVENLEALKLYQNNPNPFVSTTEISFENPAPGWVYFEVTNVIGEVLFRNQQFYEKGMQSINLSKTEILETGVMFYSITANHQKLTKRMISLR